VKSKTPLTGLTTIPVIPLAIPLKILDLLSIALIGSSITPLIPDTIPL